MNKKILLLLFMCMIGTGWMLPVPAFTQPAINMYPDLDTNFEIVNSNVIIIAFNRTMQGVNTGISLSLPPGINTFTATKQVAGGPVIPCPTDGFTACGGSLVTVDGINPGSITITNVAEPAGTALFVFTISAQVGVIVTDCTWNISPAVNADMEYAQAIPDIVSTSPAEEISGATGVELDVSSSAPVYEPPTLVPAPSIASYSWVQVGTPSVINFTETDTATPSFNAPTVSTLTDLTFELTIVDNAGLESTGTITVTLKNRANPVDAVLLMDTSGSMGWYKTGSLDDLAGGCCSRLASAKVASKYFIDRLKTFAEDSRIGVAIFPAEPAPGTNYGDRYSPSVGLADVTGFEAVKNDIGGETASCTCNGVPGSPGTPTGIPVNWNGTPTRYGLDAARAMFPADPDKSRMILLLSDGAYNIGDPPDEFAYINDFLTTDGIHIYTVGIGEGTDNVNHTSLQNISNNTDNPLGFTTFNLGDALDSSLIPYFEKIMGHMVSLDFNVDPPNTIEPGQTKSHNALTTSNDSVVSITISWGSSTIELLYVYITTPSGLRLKPKAYEGYSNLTLKGDDLKRAGSGGWKIEVYNHNSEKFAYNYSVITKSSLNMRTVLDKATYYTGNTMLIEARPMEKNLRMTGVKVRAIITRPDSGIGNWHYENYVPREYLDRVPDVMSGEPMSLLDKKNVVLLQEWEKELPEIITLPELELNDKGKYGDKCADDGIYSATFTDFSAPGIYKFHIIAKGETYKKQKFQRESEVQKYVDMAASRATTKVVGRIEKIVKGSATISVSVTPRDNTKMKNYLGPGFEDGIIIRSSEGKPDSKTVEDLLDGTYKQRFIIQDMKDPEITVIVRGVVIYRGPFSKILELK